MKNKIKNQLVSLKEYACKNHVPIVSDEVLTLLIDTIKHNDCKNILEIGTAIGYSGTAILNINNNIKLTTIEKDIDRYTMAKDNFDKLSIGNRVELILSEAKLQLSSLKKNNAKFDFVFLDGPKGQYLNYLEDILKLLNSNGIIFCDNMNYEKYIENDGFIPKKHRTIAVNLKKFTNEILFREDLRVEFHSIGDKVCVITKL